MREVKAYKAIKDRVFTRSIYGPKNEPCFDLYMDGQEKIFRDKTKALEWLGHKPGVFYFDKKNVKQEYILEEIEIQ